jgi:magnesium-transporting ATPase (P-type)
VTKIEQYVKEITLDLPDDEQKELREEIYIHLQDHVKELLIKGYSEEKAVRHAIESFGNQGKLNRELKRALFPFYKLIRFVWCVIFVTGLLCFVSYSAMEYYHPEFNNSLPLYSVLMAMFLVTLIAGTGEVFYEALASQFNTKWLLNPWIFFLVPSLVFGGIQTPMLFKHPEQYQDSLLLDLYAVPIGAFAYIISRQLFTLLFVRNKNNYKRTKVN